jgi:acetyl-CoA acetyltransferase family protein
VQFREVYLVDYARTAFSKAKPEKPEQDVFNSIRIDQALGEVLKFLVRRNGINTFEIDDVIVGCALQVGENWLFGGRHPVFLADFPVEVPSQAVDRQCSSSMNAISTAAFEIMTGHAEIALAGGMEHMTHVPMQNNSMISPNLRLLLRPEYAKYQLSIGYYMGLTAEKLAEESDIGRREMDEFSLESHRRSVSSYDAGWFTNEILPIDVEVGGEVKKIDKDQSVRRDTTLEKLASLPPAFKEGGVITAGNSSPMNSGASAVVLMSEKKVKEYGLKPLAKVVSFGWAGVDPSVMGKGPVPATQKALTRAGVKVDEIDLWEINEAFSVVVLYTMRELKLRKDSVNIHGGAIAIGHPLGATGSRLVGTLARELVEHQKRLGVATLCVGGGQGYATVLEKF